MATNKKVEKLVDYFMEKEYGVIVYHQEIAALIDAKYGSYAYKSIVNTAKKKLLESGHMIDSVRKSGYQVVEPDAYTDKAVGKVHSAVRNINDGQKIMDNAPVNDMSPVGLEIHNQVNDRFRLVRASMTGSKVEITMLSKKREHPMKQLQA